ncbi:putative MFS transporter [Bacillus sp. TS-2]|nr:putative MFS transporter [Bacillus sp. TS-2]
MNLFSRNYSVLLSGTFIKAVGTGIYSVAAMLLVLELTNNVFYSGLTFFFINIPNIIGFLIAPFANYISYKKGLIVCEFLKSILLLSIPLLYMVESLHVFYVIGIMFLVAMISQFTYPIESTLVPAFVGEENVVRANSLMNMLRESLDIVFLTVAGLVIAFIGNAEVVMITAVCHGLTGFLYMLFTFKIEHTTLEKATLQSNVIRYKKDLSEGFQVIWGSHLKKVVVPAIVVNFFTGGLFAILPAFSLQQGGSEHYYGYYLAALTFGMLIGSMLTPLLKDIAFGKMIVICFIFSGLCMIGVGLVPSSIGIVLMAIAFFWIAVVNILIFSLIQSKVEIKLVGRVITVVSSIAGLCTPLGSLFGGFVGTIELHYPIILAGIALVIVAIYYYLNKRLRALPKIDEIELLLKKTSTNKEVKVADS